MKRKITKEFRKILKDLGLRCYLADYSMAIVFHGDNGKEGMYVGLYDSFARDIELYLMDYDVLEEKQIWSNMDKVKLAQDINQEQEVLRQLIERVKTMDRLFYEIEGGKHD